MELISTFLLQMDRQITEIRVVIEIIQIVW